MNDKFILNILKFIDLFKPLYKKLGVNYEMMRLILQHKLIMDSRRTLKTMNGETEDNKNKNQFKRSLIVYFIIGLFATPIMFVGNSNTLSAGMYYSFFMIMILSIFITDFSNVLLDIKDKEILVTKGVDLNTLNVAKLTHIVIYIASLSLAITIGGIVLSFRQGILFGLLFIVNIVLIDIMMIMITALVYFVILKVFSGEKLKDIINGFQIIFLLIFAVGYQVLVRLFSFIDFNMIYEPKLWNIVLMPMWFGANLDLLQGKVSSIIIAMSVLSIVVPIVALVAYVRLIPVFENNLQKLASEEYIEKNKKFGLSKQFANIFCKEREEKAFFNFVYNILKKDREYKTRTYPQIALGLFLPLLMLISMYDKTQGISGFLQELKTGFYYLNGYMTVIMTQSIISTLKYSKEYESAWIYDSLPIKNKGNIFSGMFKAATFNIVIPIYLIMSVIFILLFGISSIIHVFIMFLVSILSSIILFKFSKKELPFTMEYENNNSGENMATMFSSLLIVGVMFIIHLIVKDSYTSLAIYALLLMIFIKISYRSIRNVAS